VAKPPRQLVVILGLNLVVALLFFLLAKSFVPPALQDDSLSQIADLLHPSRFERDSWYPMQEVLKYWQSNPDNRAIYSDLLIGNSLRFQYPPTTLLIPSFLEVSKIDPNFFYISTIYLFLVITILSVFAITLFSLKTFAYVSVSSRQAMLLLGLVCIITLMYYPITKAITLNQIQAWLNALFALSLLCYMTGHTATAGILIGIMASVKPQYGLFVLWGLVRKDHRFTLGLMGSVIVGLIAGITVFGLPPFIDYFNGLNFLSRHGEGYYSNQSFNGLVNRFFSVVNPELYDNIELRDHTFVPYNSWVYSITLASSLAILAFCLIGAKKGQGYRSIAGYCLMAIGVTMASPIAWRHHYGILLSIFAFLWPVLWFSREFDEEHKIRRLVLIAFIVSGNFYPITILLAPTFLNFLQSYLLFAAIILMFVLRSLKERTDLDRVGGR
jgi:alpha-1,2-mannosyltransferase